jgi:monoamine oxidase
MGHSRYRIRQGPQKAHSWRGHNFEVKVGPLERRDILVIGAGAAGLAAARVLRAAGRDVLVLERAARLGGRIHTVHPLGPDLTVELGAEFLHGDAPATRALLEELGVRQVEGEGELWHASGGRLRRTERHFERVGRVLARIDTDAPDRSFAKFLRGTRVTRDARAAALRFVQGFHAADPERISAHSLAAPAGDVAEVRRSGRVLAGQHSLVSGLAAAAGAELRPGCTVQRLTWRHGFVEAMARTDAGEVSTVQGRAALVTVSIGVLQGGDLRIEPEPPGYAAALGRLAMGDVVRIPFIFRRRFWDDHGLGRAAFIHTPDSPFNAWWTQYPVLSPMLVAWAGGPAARALLRTEPALRAGRALHDLAAALGRRPATLEREVAYWETYDWTRDPATLGAYSYALTGGAHAARQLARVHAGTLAFAGEALAEASGTVEGALRSGDRAARALLRRRR